MVKKTLFSVMKGNFWVGGGFVVKGLTFLLINGSNENHS